MSCPEDEVCDEPLDALDAADSVVGWVTEPNCCDGFERSARAVVELLGAENGCCAATSPSESANSAIESRSVSVVVESATTLGWGKSLSDSIRGGTAAGESVNVAVSSSKVC